LRRLIVVAGHGAARGTDFAHLETEAAWALEPFQQVAGQARTFVEHAREGVRAAAADPGALLLFSGAETRRNAPAESEGHTYWKLSEARGWFEGEGVPGGRAVERRAVTEEGARDSLENLLFSLCRFHELTGGYPEQVTVVGYRLKERRFADLHRGAARFPAERFRYVGTEVLEAVAHSAADGEAATRRAWERDLYGCGGELERKRKRRDPFASGGHYAGSCPELRALLEHCGPGRFEGPLPWDGWADPA